MVPSVPQEGQCGFNVLFDALSAKPPYRGAAANTLAVIRGKVLIAFDPLPQVDGDKAVVRRGAALVYR